MRSTSSWVIARLLSAWYLSSLIESSTRPCAKRTLRSCNSTAWSTTVPKESRVVSARRSAALLALPMSATVKLLSPPSRADDSPPLLFVLALGPRRPARVHPEEIVHGLLVLLERLGPEVQVGPPGVGDGVHPARRSPPGGLPGGLDDALLLHLPQRPVQRPRVHSLEPEGRGPLHEQIGR